MGDDFQRDLVGKTIQQLRQEYPSEAACHRAMLARRKSHGAIVSKGLHSFRDFLRVLGPRPNKSWTVDRIDVTDPEYAPGKVRWADKRQQANNRTTTTLLNVRGEIKPLTDWARQTGQKSNTIRARLRRGSSHEAAVYPRRRRTLQTPVEPSEKPSTGTGEVQNWPPPLEARHWEPAYAQWVKAFKGRKGLPLTRTVFALWVVSGLTKLQLTELSRRHPDQFLQDGDPDGDDNSVLDELHASYLAYEGARQHLLSCASWQERHFWLNTLRMHIVTDTTQAIAKAQELMKNYDPNDGF